MEERTAEQYVRSRWECPVQVWTGKPLDGEFRAEQCWTVSIVSSRSFQRKEVQEAWSAAYYFTIEREEQIRQVETEIAWLEGFSSFAEHSIYGPARERILSREHAALAELKRSMKDAAQRIQAEGAKRNG